MPRAVLLLVTVGVAIYALVDLVRSRPEEIRGLPKLAWVVVIALVPLAGSLAYLVLGRVGAGLDRPGPGSGPQVIAPDDDPDFLRSLDWERRRKERPSPDDPDEAEPAS
jgi:hypothetical protein